MFCVALTGSIASGKSTVAHFFKILGVDVFSADTIAQQLTMPGTDILKRIVEHFGPSILTPTKELNRRSLRQLIFANKNERLWLEGLLHPLIRQTLGNLVKQSQSPYCVLEIPLLVSLENYPYINRVLLVESPLDEQLKRLMLRDNITQNDALAILDAQPTPALRRQLANDFIINDGTLTQLQEKTQNLHQHYLLACCCKNSNNNSGFSGV